MNIEFRKCDYNDLDFILKLKELCMKWYIEKIYGWDNNIQREKTMEELNMHINDMRIITLNDSDIGVTTFFEESHKYVVGLIMIHPDYQRKGIATKIINDYINKARSENKNIEIKTYKHNPAKRLYERLGFKQFKEDDTHIYLNIELDK